MHVDTSIAEYHDVLAALKRANIKQTEMAKLRLNNADSAEAAVRRVMRVADAEKLLRGQSTASIVIEKYC